MSAGTRIGDDEAISLLRESADRLFSRNGIVGVTVAAVRDASGLSLRRIYNICPSKADLVSLWLRHRHTVWTQSFIEQVDAGLASGSNPVDAVFDAISNWLVETEFQGCGFLNTHAETSELTPEHAAIIRDHKRSVAHYLDGVTGRGDAIGLLVDGAVVHASVFRDLSPVETARVAAHDVLGSAPRAASAASANNPSTNQHAHTNVSTQPPKRETTS